MAAASAGFLAGAIFVVIASRAIPHLTHIAIPGSPQAASRQGDRILTADDGGQGVFEDPRDSQARLRPLAMPTPSFGTTPVIETDPVRELRDRQLTYPVDGAARRDLRDSFNDARGSIRSHEAVDIMAPRNTPILAVEGGTIARLFESRAGGTTVYEFDPTNTYVYYYAHLERYADGLREGDHVQRAQVLGYVGTSGNAPPNTPHLHFAIFRLTDKKQWWQGHAIDPYDVLR